MNLIWDIGLGSSFVSRGLLSVKIPMTSSPQMYKMRRSSFRVDGGRVFLKLGGLGIWTVPFPQSMVGLVLRSQGSPKIIDFFPRFVMRNFVGKDTSLIRRLIQT